MVAPSGRVRLALDAMGGDHGPAEVVPGGIRWAKENPHDELILVGDEPLLLELAGGTLPANTRIVHGPDVIGMDEHPAQALRERKGASILVATNLVREGLADAVVTAGHRPHSNKGEAHAVLAMRCSRWSVFATSAEARYIAIRQRRYVLPISTGLAISGWPLRQIRHKS